MIVPPADRGVRLHNATRADQRRPFERDRDRILYSSAFRRLAGVTQVARSGEADFFHTRLTHRMKVAQVGRRLAEHTLRRQPGESAVLGVHPEVVEAACLAHDLGHPPFGHLGESILNRLVIKAGDTDGFEGNAQSFRILTRLAVRFEKAPGLDLTRAVLAAAIKYPWVREPDGGIKERKWGYYRTEQADFDFVRDGADFATKTAEAELMDWADDIAYSVHDLEDFHRGRMLPWLQIFSKEGEERLVEAAAANQGASRTKLRRAHKLIRSVTCPTDGIQPVGNLDLGMLSCLGRQRQKNRLHIGNVAIRPAC